MVRESHERLQAGKVADNMRKVLTMSLELELSLPSSGKEHTSTKLRLAHADPHQVRGQAIHRQLLCRRHDDLRVWSSLHRSMY